VGEDVAAGDTLAAAGDSGGSSRPEVYFEIRKGGKPVDPRPWFRSPDP
jgi:septal ring factor EnvC (AmiA/AmiB activator)